MVSAWATGLVVLVKVPLIPPTVSVVCTLALLVAALVWRTHTVWFRVTLPGVET